MKHDRIFETWIARQRAGKTTALRSRVRALYRDTGIRSVWVLDALGEWPDGLGLADVVEVDRASYLDKTSHGFPRVCLWRVDPDDKLTIAFIWQEAVAQGDIALILDEASLYAPGPHWTGEPMLKRIVLQGRHLPDMCGKLRPTHLIVAVQYPRLVNHLVWSQSPVIMVGQVAGESTRKWIASNFGDPILAEADRVRPFGWIAVRGIKPSMPGYGPTG
jgi:hypothetical protein